jgi:predicted cupin superfamily sugar epimerase
MTAADIIRLLELKPHPEGGYYRETFRDSRTIDASGRAASTAIYFVLQRDEVSRWHTVDAVETWHYHAGAPLELTIKDGAKPREKFILGTDFAVGQRPQRIVPFMAWQMARSLGDWTLVGCTVAPGFTFEGFTLAEPGFEPGA